MFDGLIVGTIYRVDEKSVTAAVHSIFDDGQPIENAAQLVLLSEAAFIGTVFKAEWSDHDPIDPCALVLPVPDTTERITGIIASSKASQGRDSENGHGLVRSGRCSPRSPLTESAVMAEQGFGWQIVDAGDHGNAAGTNVRMPSPELLDDIATTTSVAVQSPSVPANV